MGKRTRTQPDEIDREAKEVLALLFDRRPSDAIIIMNLADHKRYKFAWWRAMAKAVFGLTRVADAKLLMPEGVLVQIKQFNQRDHQYAYIDATYRIPLAQV